MLCTGMALTQPIAGSGGDIVVKIRLHCYPAAGQGFAHGSGPWAKQCIQLLKVDLVTRAVRGNQGFGAVTGSEGAVDRGDVSLHSAF